VSDEPLKDLPQVQESLNNKHVTLEVSDAQHGDVDASAGGITITEVNDKEIGVFISVSSVGYDSGNTQLKVQEDGVHGNEAGQGGTSQNTSGVGDTVQEDTRAKVDTSNQVAGTPDSSNQVAGTPDPSDQVAGTLDQVSSLSESTTVPANNDIDSSVPSGQLLTGVKDVGVVPNQSPEVDRLSVKKDSVKMGASRTGKKVPKNQQGKDKQKKSRRKAEAVVDDNQSEISYQPDTDLSRSKASKKVNSE
jgi:hypothetical protein